MQFKGNKTGEELKSIQTTHFCVFVIPGLTRNPLLFHSMTLLDAGSGPA